MKATRKKRTWFMVSLLVIAISIVATAANFNQDNRKMIASLNEDELVMESWMGDPAYLDNVIAETPVELEQWMSDPTYMDEVLIEDEPMPMERWMSNTNYLN